MFISFDSKGEMLILSTSVVNALSPVVSVSVTLALSVALSLSLVLPLPPAVSHSTCSTQEVFYVSFVPISSFVLALSHSLSTSRRAGRVVHARRHAAVVLPRWSAVVRAGVLRRAFHVSGRRLQRIETFYCDKTSGIRFPLT